MENNELGKRFVESVDNKPLDLETVFNTSQSPEIQQLSQLKSPEAIQNFIDGLFGQILEQTKDTNKKEEDLEKVKSLLNQYGSFVSSLTNKEEAAGSKMC